jgi:hypothetical protein
MYFSRYAPLLLFLFVLAACTEPERINFATDPRILRGIWVGTYQEGMTFVYQEGSGGLPVRLELSASYSDERHYQVTGTLTLGTEPPLNLVGMMDGSAYQIYTQAPPPAALEANLRDATGTETRKLRLYAPLWEKESVYFGSISNAAGKTQGSLKIQRQ